ncbi:MAG: hypothetical protein Kow00121_59690 [Elainellaceae cyanobacterium]
MAALWMGDRGFPGRFWDAGETPALQIGSVVLPNCTNPVCTSDSTELLTCTIELAALILARKTYAQYFTKSSKILSIG